MSVYEVGAPPSRISFAPLAPLAPLCKPDLRDTLLDRLCEVAHALPDEIALVAADGTVTFDSLTHRTYALARKIAHLTAAYDKIDISNGTFSKARPIAVEATGTIESITLMLAVVAAGHAVVPLDTDLPEARLQQMVEQAAARRIDGIALRDAEDSAAPLPTVTGDRTALIAFGAAEGVHLSHRMCLSKAYEVSTALGLTPRDRVGNALPLSGGAGLHTLLAGLLSGARVYCRDSGATDTDTDELTTPDLMSWIASSSLTTLHCSSALLRSVPSLAPSLRHAGSGGTAPALRVVASYGEAGGVTYDEYRGDRVLPSTTRRTAESTAGTLPGVDERKLDSADVLVPLRSGGSKDPVFLVGRFLLDRFLASIGPDRPVYGFRPDGWNRRARLRWGSFTRGSFTRGRLIDKTADRYLQAIRQVVPSGRVVVVAQSFGGVVALSMAQKMRAAGDLDPKLVIVATGDQPAAVAAAIDRVADA